MRRGWWRGTRLVAARELRERVRSRAFRIATAVSVLALLGVIVIPTLRDDKAKTYRVALVGAVPPAVPPTIAESAGFAHARTILTGPMDEAAATRGLREGTYDFAVVDGRRIVLERAFSSGDESRLARVVTVLSQSLGLQVALEAAGLPAAEASGAVRAPPVAVSALGPAKASPTRRYAAFIGTIVLFVLIMQYAGWVLTGVVEEKTSRVVEVLLCSLRPTQLLVGKVLGIGLLALGHASVMLTVGLTARAVTGSSVIEGISPGAMAWTAVWFLLGFALYATLYAAAGSLVSRVEDAQNASGPLMLPIFLGYASAVSVIGGSDPSWFLRVLAFFPFTAPFDMPVLIALGEVPMWQVAISIGLMLAAIVGLSILGGVVYSRSILRAGKRLKWRDALRAPAT